MSAFQAAQQQRRSVIVIGNKRTGAEGSPPLHRTVHLHAPPSGWAFHPNDIEFATHDAWEAKPIDTPLLALYRNPPLVLPPRRL